MRAVKERRKLRGSKDFKPNFKPKAGDDTVRVIVRVRPLLRDEKKVCKAVVHVNTEKSLQIQLSKDEIKQFKFTACVGPEISQRDFFEQCGVKKLVDSSLQGYAATIFAYGQTGSGKTFSMSGVEERLDATTTNLGNESSRGVIPRSVRYLFDKIQEINLNTGGAASRDGSPGAMRIRSVEVRASFAEIYNEQVFDLLNSTQKSLSIREDTSKGFYVQGLSVFNCDSAADMLAVLQEGHRNRRVGSHNLNKDSSRSHSLLSVYVTSKVGDVNSAVGDGDSDTEFDNQLLEKKGKIVFVDLAGSERLRDTGTKGKHLKETTNINKSLFTLGKVISGLSKGQANVMSLKHIPYRDSKLTMLLKDSLGGNCKTLMVACVSPAKPSAEESLSTLNYATRAKNIVNKPVLMMDPKEKLLLHYKNEIRILKLENEYLREQARGHHPPPRHDDFYHHQHQHQHQHGGYTRHEDPRHLPSIHDTSNPHHPRGRANTYASEASKVGPVSRHMKTAASDPPNRTSPRTSSLDANWQVQPGIEQIKRRLAECEEDNELLRKQNTFLEQKLKHVQEVFVGDIAEVAASPVTQIPSGGRAVAEDDTHTLELQDTIHHLRVRETQLMAEVARLRRATY